MIEYTNRAPWSTHFNICNVFLIYFISIQVSSSQEVEHLYYTQEAKAIEPKNTETAPVIWILKFYSLVNNLLIIARSFLLLQLLFVSISLYVKWHSYVIVYLAEYFENYGSLQLSKLQNIVVVSTLKRVFS